MATYTSNYALHQWEDSDDFLRTDFNEDFSKIDTALGGIQSDTDASFEEVSSDIATLQTATANNAYNIYNLMLQNYYEGKYTGYKNALLFDGFNDSTGITSLSTGFVHTQQGLHLCQTAQSSVIPTVGSSSLSNASYRTSPVVTLTGSGTLTAFRFYAYTTGTTQTNKVYNYTVYINDVAYRTGTYTASTVSTSAAYYTVSLSPSIPMTAGETIYISIRTEDSNNYQQYYCENGSTTNIWAQLTFTSTAASEGTLVAAGESISWTSAYGWVRYTGGTVALSLVNSGTAHSLTLTETASTTTHQGDSCTEGTFFIEKDSAVQGTVVPKLVATCSSNKMSVYDYGIILI